MNRHYNRPTMRNLINDRHFGTFQMTISLQCIILLLLLSPRLFTRTLADAFCHSL